jgi:hypothetical protein
MNRPSEAPELIAAKNLAAHLLQGGPDLATVLGGGVQRGSGGVTVNLCRRNPTA